MVDGVLAFVLFGLFVLVSLAVFSITAYNFVGKRFTRYCKKYTITRVVLRPSHHGLDLNVK